MPLNMNIPSSTSNMKDQMKTFSEYEVRTAGQTINVGEGVECDRLLKSHVMSINISSILGGISAVRYYGNRVYIVNAYTNSNDKRNANIDVAIFQYNDTYTELKLISSTIYTVDISYISTIGISLEVLSESCIFIGCTCCCQDQTTYNYTSKILCMIMYIDSSNSLVHGPVYIVNNSLSFSTISTGKIDTGKLIMFMHESFTGYNRKIHAVIISCNLKDFSILYGTEYECTYSSDISQIGVINSKVVQISENSYGCLAMINNGSGSMYPTLFVCDIDGNDIISTYNGYCNSDSGGDGVFIASSNFKEGYLVTPYAPYNGSYWCMNRWNMSTGGSKHSISIKRYYMSTFSRTDVYGMQPTFINHGHMFGFKNFVIINNYYSGNSGTVRNEALYRIVDNVDASNNCCACNIGCSDENLSISLPYISYQFYQTDLLDDGSWMVPSISASTLTLTHVYLQPIVHKALGQVDGVVTEKVTENSGKAVMFFNT